MKTASRSYTHNLTTVCSPSSREEPMWTRTNGEAVVCVASVSERFCTCSAPPMFTNFTLRPLYSLIYLIKVCDNFEFVNSTHKLGCHMEFSNELSYSPSSLKVFFATGSKEPKFESGVIFRDNFSGDAQKREEDAGYAHWWLLHVGHPYFGVCNNWNVPPPSSRYNSRFHSTPPLFEPRD